MAKTWFVSHPSGGPDNTPVFFAAVNDFAAEHGGIKIIWPHEEGEGIRDTKAQIEEADMVLAEVSIASTGSGIELGWASAAQKPIIAFHQGTSPISPSVPLVATAIHAYLTEEHVLKVLKVLA